VKAEAGGTMGLEGATVFKRRGARLNACLRQHFVEGGKGPTVELYHRPKGDNAFVQARERPRPFRNRIGWGGGSWRGCRKVRPDQRWVVHLSDVRLTDALGGEAAFFGVGIEASGHFMPEGVSLKMDDGVHPVAEALNTGTGEPGEADGIIGVVWGFRPEVIAVEAMFEINGCER